MSHARYNMKTKTNIPETTDVSSVGSGGLLGLGETRDALTAISEDVARGKIEPDSLAAIAAKSALQHLDDMEERLNRVREMGEVYIYPSDWRCSKMGGPPDIDAYEKVDLSDA